MENILEKSEKMILEMYEMKKETQKLIEKNKMMKESMERWLNDHQEQTEYIIPLREIY